MTTQTEAPPSFMQRVLDLVEKVGNKVPHPVLIFVMLSVFVMILSQVLYMTGARVTYQVLNPDTHKLETATTSAQSLLTGDGIRFMYTRLIPNFLGFQAIGLLVVAMVGVGVAEEAGLVNALIRKLVAVSPAWALTYILAFAGILASIAADAGYLVLIPLAGVAFLSLGRHPIAGIALGFAAVAGAFNVNMLIKPLDAVLTDITNDAIHMVNPSQSITLTSNLWFSIASVLVLTVLIGLLTDKVIEPRLGKYESKELDQEASAAQGETDAAADSRGLRFAALGFLGVLVVFGLLTLPPGAPLRDPKTGAIIGSSPFMNGLIVLIMFVFLVSGIGYGIGAGTVNTVGGVIGAMTKAVSSLGGTILLFLVISQFIAYFNYSNTPTLMAVTMADALKAADIGPLWLLLGFIVVVTILNFVFTPAIAKWAIFAPVFVPLFVTLQVDPAAVLAAYRVGDSPTNAITPMNAYFALVVGFAQKYEPTAGIGTVVSLMLPYVLSMMIVWTLLFVVWQQLGLPWGVERATGSLQATIYTERNLIMSGPVAPVDLKSAEEHLLRLLAVEGLSGEEKAIGAVVCDELRKVGVPASALRFDRVNERIPLPTQTGNLFVDLPGTRKGPRVLFITHLDTVALCAGAKPRREGNRIVSDGTTALGGDNRTGCAVLITLVETLLKHRLPYPPLSLLFAVREESGIQGCRYLDPGDLNGATMGFNVDSRLAADLITGAVGQEYWDVDIRGKAAHAGLAPERGISATLVAAVALAEARRAGWFGKVVKPEGRGTSNAGVFGGKNGKAAGDATNVVTDYVHVKGEARSPDLAFAHAITEGFREAFRKAQAEIKDAEGGVAEIQFEPSHAYPPFNLTDDTAVVRHARRAAESIGMKPNTVFSNGGLDANWLVKHGLPTVSIGAGQNEVHTVKEYVDLPEFANGCRLAVAMATLEG